MELLKRNIWPLIFFFIACSYSYIRYVLVLDVTYDLKYLYVVNKALALTVVMLIPVSIIVKHPPSRWWMNIALLLHISISYYLLNPEYFESLYIEKHQFTFFGLLFLLSGLLAAGVWLSFIFKNLMEISQRSRMVFFIIFIAMHNFFMGMNSWLSYSLWPAYLPPITLISFIILTFSLIALWRNSKKKL